MGARSTVCRQLDPTHSLFNMVLVLGMSLQTDWGNETLMRTAAFQNIFDCMVGFHKSP